MSEIDEDPPADGRRSATRWGVGFFFGRFAKRSYEVITNDPLVSANAWCSIPLKAKKSKCPLGAPGRACFQHGSLCQAKTSTLGVLEH